MPLIAVGGGSHLIPKSIPGIAEVITPNHHAVANAFGAAPFTYQWNVNGNSIFGANASTYSATLGGDYAVKVTDANGCTATTTVNITQPPVLTAANTPTAVTCNGLLNGSAVITATGGTAGYNVSWTGPSNGNPGATRIE